MAIRRDVLAVLAVLVAAAWLLGAPGAAFAVKEREPLQTLTSFPGLCGADPQVGKVTVKSLKTGGLKVKVRLKNGPPDLLLNVGWFGRDPSCNATGNNANLGILTTDASGRGRFTAVLPGGSPSPGEVFTIAVYTAAYEATQPLAYVAAFNTIFP